MAKRNKKLSESEATNILREHGFRATPVRKAALQVLCETHKCVSVQELFDVLSSTMKPKSPDWATVYRILHQFEESGLVFSFEAHGSKKYEYTDPNSNHHHHHLICRQCHRIEHLSACKTKVLNEMTKAFNFKDVTHSLEFYGLCPQCSA